MRIFPRRHISSRASTSQRREYPGESSDDTSYDRRSYRDQSPPERGRYQGQNGRPPDRRMYQDRGYSRRGRPPGRGGPPDGNGEPPDDGGPPNDGGPPRNGRPPRYPGG